MARTPFALRATATPRSVTGPSERLLVACDNRSVARFAVSCLDENDHR
jgi:hypothetical protein